MKENKDFQLKSRFTKSEKNAIVEYCQTHDLTISEFIRLACNELINRE